MQSAAKLCRESNAINQISPKPILDTNEYAKKEVGGRGGAYKYISLSLSIYIYILLYTNLCPLPQSNATARPRERPPPPASGSLQFRVYLVASRNDKNTQYLSKYKII